MIQTTTTICNQLGLHARASAKLTKLAGSFPCEVWMVRNGRRINAKSIMGVMMLAAGLGAEVLIETDGEQEEEAMQALLALIADRFGEGRLRRALAVAIDQPHITARQRPRNRKIDGQGRLTHPTIGIAYSDYH